MDREQAIKELQESHDIMRNHDIDESESYLMQALNMAIKALEQEPCEDAISRQAVLGIVDSYSESQSNVEDVTQDIISDIVALQPVNPQPKTGHWIKYGKLYQCSECKELSCCQGKFCNECGTKMVEEQESDHTCCKS